MGVQHVYKSDEDLLWPRELAAGSFSMADGRKNFFHAFPYPDPLPLGSGLDAKEKF